MDHDISPAPAPGRLSLRTYPPRVTIGTVKAERVRRGAAARQRRKRDLDRLHDELLAASNTREHRLVQALVNAGKLTERETASRRLVAAAVEDVLDTWTAIWLGEIDPPKGW